MTLKIGVMGAATGIIDHEHMAKAHDLGRVIAERGSGMSINTVMPERACSFLKEVVIHG
jgi:hypothetical protein